jgi:hypothetical protein
MARVEGKLDGKTIIGVLDTGATSSAVTRSFLIMQQDEIHLFSIQKMPEPFKYKLAHDVIDSNGTATGETESEDFEITELCRLSPEWTLPHGPLCMRDTNFLIMEASMQDEELIIGLPELKKMGLDSVRIIDEVRDNFHMIDFSDSGPTAVFEAPAKMGRMMLLRHSKPAIQDAEYGSLSDEKDIHEIIKVRHKTFLISYKCQNLTLRLGLTRLIRIAYLHSALTPILKTWFSRLSTISSSVWYMVRSKTMIQFRKTTLRVATLMMRS